MMISYRQYKSNVYILNKQPEQMIRKLNIQGYKGIKFEHWRIQIHYIIVESL